MSDFSEVDAGLIEVAFSSDVGADVPEVVAGY